MHSHNKICLLQLAEQAKAAIVYFSLPKLDQQLISPTLKEKNHTIKYTYKITIGISPGVLII